MLTTCHTVSDIAKRYGVKDDKVLAWIADKSLAAINVAQSTSGRPRWRISPESLAAFEAARATKQATPEPRQQRRAAMPGVKKFF